MSRFPMTADKVETLNNLVLSATQDPAHEDFTYQHNHRAGGERREFYSHIMHGIEVVVYLFEDGSRTTRFFEGHWSIPRRKAQELFNKNKEAQS
jgi:hypothetical protein